ncbi:MAG: hypothetical protein ACKOCU_04435 [Betaproteobacteria bacterium]
MSPTPAWQWPGGARLALSIVVNVEEGSEYSIADGDPIPEPGDELGVMLKKPVRMHGNESNYRYGIEEGGPRVLALLDRFSFTATWTAAALSLERAPALAQAIGRRIGERGDEVCAHGWRWVHQFRLAEADERAFIRRAADSIKASPPVCARWAGSAATCTPSTHAGCCRKRAFCITWTTTALTRPSGARCLARRGP